MMTAARLREIATRMEQVCVDFRKIMTGINTPCHECWRAAEDLRELANEIGPPKMPLAVAQTVAGEHQATPKRASLPARMPPASAREANNS
jgi:hypothetical protein